MWIARPEYQPGQTVLKVTRPSTGIDTGHLVAAQEVLSLRARGARPAADLLRALARVEAVRVRVPDVDVGAVDGPVAVVGVADVDLEREGNTLLRSARVPRRRGRVRTDVGTP